VPYRPKMVGNLGKPLISGGNLFGRNWGGTSIELPPKRFICLPR